MKLPVPPTNFIGRDRERAAVHALLTSKEVRLVTLTGPGGVGKTRLAIEVARDLHPIFTDGIGFVDLSPLGDPAQVMQAIANAADIHQAGGQPLLQQVHIALRGQRVLLLIDNFEHLMPVAPEIAALLGATVHLKFLLTSRTPLQLTWEYVVPITGLALPPELDSPEADVPSSEALALFVDRARATNANFEPTSRNLAAIAEICRQLDGLPLAIELSAARTRLMPPHLLLSRLDSSLDLLTTGSRDSPVRQQTLRRTLEWSYQLLAYDEQRFFALLSVFAGRFTSDAVRAVASDDILPVDDLIQAMINHSLLEGTEADDDQAVFWMLYTIRAYAGEHLRNDPNATALHRRHAGYYLELAERAEPELGSSAPLPWLHRLALAYNNLRSAFDWLMQHEHTEALRLAGALRRYWIFRGELSEGRRWLSRALAAAVDAAPPIKAKALLAAADVASGQTNIAEAIELYERSLALWELLDNQTKASVVRNNLGICYRLSGDLDKAAAQYEYNSRLWHAAGDAEKEAKALGNLGLIMLIAGKYSEADALFNTSLTMFHRLGDALAIARSLNNLGYALVLQSRFGEAEPILLESLARFRALDEKLGIANTLNNLAAAGLGTGDSTRASTCALESMQLFETLGDQNGLAECFDHLASIAAVQHQPERATQLLAAATQLRSASGSVAPPGERMRLDTLHNRLRRALGNKRFATAWLLGETLSTADALALARSQPDPYAAEEPEPQAPVSRAPLANALESSGLSSREIDVLKLLAGGLTYEQIADRLVISPRTVNRHLTSIYGKLNVETRHAAARWAIDNRLV